MDLDLLKKFFRNYHLAFASFLLIFLVVIFFYRETQKRIEQQHKQQFENSSFQARKALERRLVHYIQILKGAKGLFASSDTVSRQDWRTYVNSLEVNIHYPGIQGIGFAKFVRPERLEEHIQQIRSEGFPNYTVHPAGKREFYTPIIFLEPFTGRNLRAFGFDMYSEPVRQKAMATARDTNQPTMSGKVTLVQETEKDVQAGFLIYLPVYKNGTKSISVEERRQNLLGFVYNPFRAADLINATLEQGFPHLQIEVYDGKEITEEALLYRKDTTRRYIDKPAHDQKSSLTRMHVAGRTWSIYCATLPGFYASSDTHLPIIILIGGTLINLLVSFVIWSLSRTKRSALIKQSITDNATAAILIINAQGYCTFMNPAAEVLTGYSFEEIKQKPLHDLIHHTTPEGRAYSKSTCPIMQVAAKHQHLKTYEDVFFRKDGSSFYGSCNASPLFDVNSPGSILIELIDVTEIKEAERKIRENSALLNKIFMQVPAIVGLLRAPDQVYVLVNAQLSRLYNNQHLLGRSVAEAHPEMKENGMLDVLDKVFKTGRPYVGTEIPTTVHPADIQGQPREAFFNIVYQPILKQDQQVEAVLIFAVDVTELVLSRKQILKVNKELSQKNKELLKTNNDLDNFVYTASHDLKAPIANLEGLTTLLRRMLGKQVLPTEKEVLLMLEDSVNKLKQTIHDLTEITKVQKDLQNSVEPLSFEEVLKDVKADISSLILQSGVEIKADFQVREIEYARKNLRSIIYNLVSNAIKYSHPDREPEVLLRTFRENDHIVLQVQDNGLGIKPEQQHKLFSMFRRLHTHVEGTGIGLYIVKRIIENNGGYIKVDSAPNQGSTFSVHFSANTSTHKI